MLQQGPDRFPTIGGSQPSDLPSVTPEEEIPGPIGAPPGPPPGTQLEFEDVFPGLEPTPTDIGTTQRPPGQTRNIKKERDEDDRLTDSVLDDYALENLSDTERRQITAELPDPAFDKMTTDELLRFGEELVGIPEFGETPGFFGEAVKDPLTAARNEWNNLWSRFKASFGRNEKEVTTAITSVFGRDNVEVKDGEFFVRRNKGENFTKLDRKGFELFADIFADGGGLILEGAVAAAVETIQLQVGAGVAETGILSGNAPQAVAGGALIATAPATGAIAGVGARQGAAELLGIADPEFNLRAEAGWAVGINYAMYGLGPIAKSIYRASGKFAKSSLNKLIGLRGGERLKKITFLQREMRDYIRTVGFDDAKNIDVGLEGNIRNTAIEAYGVIDQFGNQLESGVKAVRGKAIELSGKQKWNVKSGIQKLREVLENQRITFDDEGRALFPEELLEIQAEGAEAVLREGIGESVVEGAEGLLTEAGDQVIREAAEAQTRSAFGSPSGRAQLKSMVKTYNTLRSASSVDGGVELPVLLNQISEWQALSQFGKDQFGNRLSGEQIAVYRQLQNAMGGDRHEALSQLFKGTGLEEEKIYSHIFDLYSSAIDDVNKFRLGFRKSKDVIDWANNLIKPNSFEDIVKLKNFLGENSDEWLNVRNEWILQMFNKHSKYNPKTKGIFDATNFLQDLSKFEANSEVIGQLLKPEELQIMKRMARTIELIPFDDIIRKPQIRSFIRDFMALGIADKAMPQTKARILSFWIGKNEPLSATVVETMMEEASRSGTKKRNGIFQTIQHMTQILGKMGKVKIKLRHPVTGKIVTKEVLAPVTKRARIGTLAREVAREKTPEDTVEQDRPLSGFLEEEFERSGREAEAAVNQ